RIIAIDAEHHTARVEPGVVLDSLRDEARRFGLTFAPDPSTHTHNTLGGMIGNNSCGTHSVMGGDTAHNVISLEVLTYDGIRMEIGATLQAEYAQSVLGGGRRAEIYRRLFELVDRHAPAVRSRFPDIPRRVSGYNLPALLEENGRNVAHALVGSEG